jgi:hypothetical protein
MKKRVSLTPELLKDLQPGCSVVYPSRSMSPQLRKELRGAKQGIVSQIPSGSDKYPVLIDWVNGPQYAFHMCKELCVDIDVPEITKDGMEVI